MTLFFFCLCLGSGYVPNLMMCVAAKSMLLKLTEPLFGKFIPEFYYICISVKNLNRNP